jgi:hypothetical protein
VGGVTEESFSTYLVINLFIRSGKLDFLLKDLALRFQSYCLPPVIEGAGYKHLVRSVRPASRQTSQLDHSLHTRHLAISSHPRYSLDVARPVES